MEKIVYRTETVEETVDARRVVYCRRRENDDSPFLKFFSSTHSSSKPSAAQLLVIRLWALMLMMSICIVRRRFRAQYSDTFNLTRRTYGLCVDLDMYIDGVHNELTISFDAFCLFVTFTF